MTDNYNKPSLSDERLLQLHLQSGTNEYLGELYSRYIPLVYGVALRYFRNVDEASDAVIDIYEMLATRLTRYRIGEFRPWLYVVVKNHCLQILRRKGVEIPVDFSDRIMEIADITHLLNERDDEELLTALEKCLEKLPDNQRTCIKLFFYQNRSYADVAAETLYRLKNVKSYIQNGKRNLKICIEKERKVYETE